MANSNPTVNTAVKEDLPKGATRRQAVRTVQKEAPQVVMVERKNAYSATIKHVGRNPQMTQEDVDNGTSVKYLSDIIDRCLFRTEYNMIMFSNHMYQTHDPDEMEYIETHPIFGNGIWKDSLPAHIVEKFNNDKRYLSRSDDIFTPAEA